MVAGVLERHGGIDVAVHAAVGPIVRKNILEIGGDEFKSQLETDLLGGFHFLQQVAVSMKAKGSGVIVGILSEIVRSDTPHGKMAGYVASKYALRGVLKELQMELRSSDVSVNAVAPSFLNTRLNADMPSEVRAFVVERAPTGSMRTPDDVASAVAFLCSREGKRTRGKIFSFDRDETVNL
jgi:NAD(P)-dependent dehydrogenase (short-subunit alcohol dehydrogenase family)